MANGKIINPTNIEVIFPKNFNGTVVIASYVVTDTNGNKYDKITIENAKTTA